MSHEPESETNPKAPAQSPWPLVSEGLLVAFVAAVLFSLAPRVPNDSAEAGFLFAALLAFVSVATLRFLARVADFTLRE